MPLSYISSGGIELVPCAIVLATCSMYTQCCGCSHSSQRSACVPPYLIPERCIWCVRMYLTYGAHYWVQIQRRPTELEMAQASGCNMQVVGSTLIRALCEKRSCTGLYDICVRGSGRKPEDHY